MEKVDGGCFLSAEWLNHICWYIEQLKEKNINVIWNYIGIFSKGVDLYLYYRHRLDKEHNVEVNHLELVVGKGKPSEGHIRIGKPFLWWCWYTWICGPHTDSPLSIYAQILYFIKLQVSFPIQDWMWSLMQLKIIKLNLFPKFINQCKYKKKYCFALNMSIYLFLLIQWELKWGEEDLYKAKILEPVEVINVNHQ